jgi:hypothetical protein
MSAGIPKLENPEVDEERRLKPATRCFGERLGRHVVAGFSPRSELAGRSAAIGRAPTVIYGIHSSKKQYQSGGCCVTITSHQ